MSLSNILKTSSACLGVWGRGLWRDCNSRRRQAWGVGRSVDEMHRFISLIHLGLVDTLDPFCTGVCFVTCVCQDGTEKVTKACMIGLVRVWWRMECGVLRWFGHVMRMCFEIKVGLKDEWMMMCVTAWCAHQAPGTTSSRWQMTPKNASLWALNTNIFLLWDRLVTGCTRSLVGASSWDTRHKTHPAQKG